MDKILLINDEKADLERVESCLIENCFPCERVGSAEEALKIIDENEILLTIVDVQMNENRGWSFCRKIRSHSEIPVIVVSACKNTDCIVKGLELGADDYITKPFAPEELLARIKAVLRRTQPGKRIERHGLLWDKDCFKLTYNHLPIKLTPIEFNLVGQFMQHINQVFSREQLIDLLRGSTSITDTRTIDSHVQNLRVKARKAGFPIDNHLKTVWGIGYQWVG